MLCYPPPPPRHTWAKSLPLSLHNPFDCFSSFLPPFQPILLFIWISARKEVIAKLNTVCLFSNFPNLVKIPTETFASITFFLWEIQTNSIHRWKGDRITHPYQDRDFVVIPYFWGKMRFYNGKTKTFHHSTRHFSRINLF